jgi:D-serine deaminase-like pyridoxal phosphate-dependent protein
VSAVSAGSRWEVDTPAAIVDLDALERNVARMAQRARAGGVTLRPHAKTHKCATVARLQLEAGAVGICCAKLGEAEALAAAGVGSILVTSPTSTPALARRAAALKASGVNIAVVVDHPVAAEGLASAASDAGVTLDVLIDVDVGLRRTGVATPEAAVEVWRVIAGSSALRLRGVQGYAGQVQHLAGLETRRAATLKSTARLRAAVEALRAEGATVEVITGGGTGTVQTDIELGFFTELQVGSYVFMDREYRDALGDDEDGRFETSFFVQSTVISANAPAFVTLDAGLKAFATDAGVPVPAGRWEGATYFYFGDEQGGLMRVEGQPIGLGDRVELTAPHIDPTVDVTSGCTSVAATASSGSSLWRRGGGPRRGYFKSAMTTPASGRRAGVMCSSKANARSNAYRPFRGSVKTVLVRPSKSTTQYSPTPY